MLWGDFPWEEPPRKLGKLLSWGAVARNVTRALNESGRVVPYMPPPSGASSEEHRAAMASLLRSIDVLWADVYPSSAPALKLRAELDLPCSVLLMAGGAMPKGAEAMLFPWRRILRPGDGIVFTCEADREIWQRLVSRSALREWVIPLGVDETTFRPSGPGECEATRERHGLPPESPLLLYVGRINIQKNLHTLLRMLADVRRKIPDAHLCMVGEEDDIKLAEFGARNTGYRRWLLELATALGVERDITFVQPQFGTDLARLYSAADVLVNASFYHRENFGLAQAEAQACGTPVVCTAWGGFKDVVLHGETGYLMDAVMTKNGIRVDRATGARHVTTLLRDSTLRSEMGERALRWARGRFGMVAFARALSEAVKRAGTPPVPDTASGVAYTPGPFARRYEDHKRTCGWYDDASDSTPAYGIGEDGRPHRYPQMFQGLDYEIYEELLGPYATRMARDLSPESIQSAWVPYFPSRVELDPARQAVLDLDPVWPRHHYLEPPEWELLRRVDGNVTVGRLADEIGDAGAPVGSGSLKLALWRLHVEGLLLFRHEAG
jgi:glycosyltransferase involved in cell wall biosynthesis